LPESAEAVLLLLAAGFAGGVVNAAAGGAKLFVFPLLLASGLPPIAANATGTVAMWPATIPAVFVQRDLFGTTFRARPLPILVSILGAAGGALTLLTIGERVFMDVVPFLLGLATLSIGLGRHVRLLVPKGVTLGPNHPVALALLFAIAFYGGFFGAGMGFMMIAVFTLTVSDSARRANAEKNVFGTLINTVAVVPLALSGLVSWTAAALVLVGGLLGGYAGGRLTLILPDAIVRIVIVILGTALTISFLLRT
jgi:uncharacterized membrane protein YfcA